MLFGMGRETHSTRNDDKRSAMTESLLKSGKVLVVDDDPEMRIFIGSLIEHCGYVPVLAAGGEEGLRKAFEDPPDLIILDLMVTREGAIQMYGELQGDEDLKHIPVIMLSDVDEKIFNHYWMSQYSTPSQGPSRPAAYLEKPPEADELRQWVDRLVNRPG